MKAWRVSSIARIVAVSGLVTWALVAPAVRADVVESARMLPDNVAVMLSVESVKDLRAALEKTSLYGFYRDPAMQPVVRAAEKKVRERIDTALKDFWRQAKLETPPEQIPYPEGRVVFGLCVAMPPAPAGAEANDQGKKDKGPGVLVQMVLLADLGSRADQARQIVQALSANVIGADGGLQKKEFAGIPMDVRMPREGKDEPTICYGFKDNWLLVTLDESPRPDFTEAMARRVGRTLPDNLADKPGFRAAVQTLGDSQVFVFANPDVLRALAAAAAKDKAKIEQVLKGLGLANVTGLAGAVRVAGDRGQELCGKGLLGLQGAPAGVPALLGPASGPLKVNERLLTRDVIGFVCANYEPARLFDELNRVFQQAAYQDLNMIAQAAMAATAGDGGQPPVQVRDEILAQLGAPLLVTWSVERPYGPTSRLKFLVALPVRDADRLDAALGRVHKAFLRGDPSTRRELLNHTLYLVPLPGSTENPTPIASSVAGDHLVVGPVDEVEQAIRNLQTEPQDSHASDPMFRYARERLPAQAGLYFYRNDRLDWEFAWATLKETIRNLTEQAKGQAGKPGTVNPAQEALRFVAEFVDLSQLPDFPAVQQYWGATVGFLQSRPEGLYWETTTLKPPQP